MNHGGFPAHLFGCLAPSMDQVRKVRAANGPSQIANYTVLVPIVRQVEQAYTVEVPVVQLEERTEDVVVLRPRLIIRTEGGKAEIIRAIPSRKDRAAE